ncbi:SDR family NAD(P)-dependent oxidoreductase [Flavisphingomonas formosensis]|uniref:SDR family NAD(P)-dependent oxidoreductase n=1 Tax=Flavisphingomonas formosensis TaxID=861534 RepID=UPI0012F97BF7|nr:SDR family NAD(P)-dependent oxidoreductase [Sphingomonas formosensis]
MSLYALIKSNGPSGFGYRSTAEDVTAGVSLAGKRILVTGCNSGLGFETMRVLAQRGAHVVGTARTTGKARDAAMRIRESAEGIACELSDPASIRACVAALKAEGVPLDAMVCNAGIMALPKLEQAFGYELQFFTNHIGHFMLVTGLTDLLAEDGRVVMLSSAAHRMAPKEGIQFDNLSGEKGYKAGMAYGQSKLANLLFAKELARRFAGSERTANAVHPGVIATNLMRHIPVPRPILAGIMGLLSAVAFKTVPQGAATQCYAAANPQAAALNGQYLADCNIAPARPDAEDAALAARLWDVSEQIVAKLP